MKDIKFRAWDTFNERMIDEPYLFQQSTEYDRIEGDERYNAPFTYYEDWQDVEDGIRRPCHIMQFTGLKDKNGKEIYEGDIVEADGLQSIIVHDFSDARKFVSPVINDVRKLVNKRSNYIVYWHDNFLQFSFKPLIDQTFIDPDVNKRNMEVIGNIYENPYLLK